MAHKKKYKRKKEFKPYEETLKEHPELEGVILKSAWEGIDKTTDTTVGKLEELWLGNMEANVRNKLWRKHGPARKDCRLLGKNKATIAVGAGQSFNLNKDALRLIMDEDGVRDWQSRNFITIASNHQFKPLLDMGIIPDFVMLTDGGDIAFPQLTEDIPDEGQNTVLFAGLHCSPKVLEAWSKQGRDIRFYIATTRGIQNKFNKLTGKNPLLYMLYQGGNVLNAALAMSAHVLGSRVFMCIGNDLSFPIDKNNIQEQRNSYYSDGDYSSNQPGTGSGRDEAKSQKRWAGFTLRKKQIYTGKDGYKIDLEIVGTSATLWVYKTWLESQMLMNYHNPKAPSVHYYNCSESGILGVMAREGGDKLSSDKSNWFMLDEACPHWHTSMLVDAVKHFKIAKEALWQGKIQLTGVQSATGSAQIPLLV